MGEYDTDPHDQLRRELVGPWVQEKHRLLAWYVHASGPARGKKGGTPCFIDPYCGPGRIRLRNEKEGRDGGALVAISSSLSPPSGKAYPFKQAFVADLQQENVDACETRLRHLNIPVSPDVGTAVDSIPRIANLLPKSGLHLAFLDPYAIDALPFSVIKALSDVPNVDLLIHFASGDVKRNLGDNEQMGRFEAVAPGWSREPQHCSQQELRRRFFAHWSKLVRACGYHLSSRPYKVTNSKRSEMYMLTVAAKHRLGPDIWDSLRLHPQRDLF